MGRLSLSLWVSLDQSQALVPFGSFSGGRIHFQDHSVLSGCRAEVPAPLLTQPGLLSAAIELPTVPAGSCPPHPESQHWGLRSFSGLRSLWLFLLSHLSPPLVSLQLMGVVCTFLNSEQSLFQCPGFLQWWQIHSGLGLDVQSAFASNGWSSRFIIRLAFFSVASSKVWARWSAWAAHQIVGRTSQSVLVLLVTKDTSLSNPLRKTEFKAVFVLLASIDNPQFSWKRTRSWLK